MQMNRCVNWMSTLTMEDISLHGCVWYVAFLSEICVLQKREALDVGPYRQLLDVTKSDFTIHPPYDNKKFISHLCQVCNHRGP